MEEKLQPEQTSMDESVFVSQLLKLKFNDFKVCSYKSGIEKIVCVRLH